jgi:hypothetical protein
MELNKNITGIRNNRSVLIRYIQLCEQYKSDIISKSKENSQNLFIAGAITKKAHDLGIYETFKNRPAQEWIDYYDHLIEGYKNKIHNLDYELEKSKTNPRIHFANYTFLITLLLITSGLFILTDNYWNGITGMVVRDTTTNVTILNVAPNMTNVTISPVLPFSYENLTCNATAIDDNLDPISFNYVWYNNGVIAESATNSSILMHTNTTEGENWTCQATPYDGNTNGNPMNASVIIQGSPLNVTKIEITDNGGNYNSMLVTPIDGSSSNVAIRATIYDKDGYGNHTITAYLCDPDRYSRCNDTNYSYAKNLTYLSAGPSAYTLYYTYNGTTGTSQFWNKPGTWRLYVKAIDPAYNSFNQTNFTYSELLAINYSVSILSLGSTINVEGQWNNGTRSYIITNFGNVNLSLSWNSSDMIGALDSWILNGTDFAVDDDNSSLDDTDNLAMVYLNSTPKIFEPASGLLACTSNECTNSNSTLNTYFHIAPPANITAGVYNNTITLTVTKKS